MKETVKKNWAIADIPSQAGKLAVVTGATGGLGYETALGLAQAGAEVILAGRNEAKGADAVRRILAVAPGAKVRFGMVDLASLASVAAFAKDLLAQDSPIDILVNNAAVMATPTRQTTKDGFELQLGTNYLSHFALTARLLPLLVHGGQTRVVQVSSLAHRQGKIHFDDLQLERGYTPWKAYTQSKLAMLIFALELQKRSDASGWGLVSNAAHPGYARTDIIANGPGADSMQARLHRLIGPLFSHSSAAGALPTLYAATAPEARPAGYYGPAGFYEIKGSVAASFVAATAKDEVVARRLWEVSEELTGVAWTLAEGKKEQIVTARAKV
jgi:NAD(P)-dependent dehydrogenase (short-subunit alcohol dehydrogenase family)